MCDFNPVRNWLIAALVALGGAVSSVIFGLVWPLFAPGAFWAAAGWCALTIGFVLAADSALRAFCACASGSSACTGPCSTLRTLMTMLITAMIVAAAVCIATAVQGYNPWLGGLFLVDAFIVTGIAIAIIAYLVSLASCIARSTPPTPPGGTGVGTSGGTGAGTSGGTGVGTSGGPPI
jgi:hypothetical protein